MERLVCQASEFRDTQPAETAHISNDQAAAEANDPQAADTLAQLGRLDSYRVVFYAEPGQRPTSPPRAFTTCYVEAYQATSGASQAVEGVGPFPPNVQVQEVQPPPVGEESRAYQGTVTDSGGHQSPLAVLLWRRGRFVGTVTIQGLAGSQALSAAQREAVAMDARMSQAR